MKRAVFWTAVIAGTMMMSGAAMADSDQHRGDWKPGQGDHGGRDGDRDHGNGHENQGPLPIAALGFPIAAGLLGYAIRRKKA